VPLIANLLSTTINVSLSYYFLFIAKSGILGMAFAISTASILETIVLTIILYSYAKFAISELLLPLGKILFATVLTGFALWVPLRVLDQIVFDTTRTAPLIMLTISVGLIGIGFYITLSYFLRVRELSVFLALAEKIGGYKNALSQSKEKLDADDSSV
jgi:peptidoglycan biosynthesis protein MviN/MurJ (putative lipid II flippase)